MADTLVTGPLSEALEAQKERLLPCVHCGFCLPACPTYNRLGDENDSPRGRLHLMKAVVEGRLDADSDAFQLHIDRCLGCRACEPVCPSGVEYGTLLELARETAGEARPRSRLTRALLFTMARRPVRAVVFLGGRVLRATGLARLLMGVMPASGLGGQLKQALAMLIASEVGRPPPGPSSRGSRGLAESTIRDVRVAMLTGCVQAGLYGRINGATERTLGANGYALVSMDGQNCCGALHAHAGDLDGARSLARQNIEAFERSGASAVAVNAAGCGASMKDYGTLFEGDPEWSERARLFAAAVSDVSELLVAAGPRRGAAVDVSIAYDHPCHLVHAQGVRQPPLDVLDAVPGVDVRIVQNADECCGGAGIYAMTHPELGGEIGRDKVEAVRATGAQLACTPNAGCMMQIGAGLRLTGDDTGTVHPVELLDESYKRAGYYR
ncbi:MAG: heterodisulfide reductase-related iron-sulfur binding cluster [Gemmatimonadota bacterium]